jgi:hypothetical protein
MMLTDNSFDVDNTVHTGGVAARRTNVLVLAALVHVHVGIRVRVRVRVRVVAVTVLL